MQSYQWVKNGLMVSAVDPAILSDHTERSRSVKRSRSVSHDRGIDIVVIRPNYSSRL
jgi:hypothetical protein